MDWDVGSRDALKLALHKKVAIKEIERDKLTYNQVIMELNKNFKSFKIIF